MSTVNGKKLPSLMQVKFLGQIDAGGDRPDTFSAIIEEQAQDCSECGATNHASPWRLTVKVSAKPIQDQRFPTLEAAMAVLRSEYILP